MDEEVRDLELQLTDAAGADPDIRRAVQIARLRQQVVQLRDTLRTQQQVAGAGYAREVKTARELLDAIREGETPQSSIWSKVQDISQEDFNQFLESLKINQSLRNLRLANLPLDVRRATLLGRALQVNSRVTTLTLQQNGMNDAAIVAFSKAFKLNKALKHLSIKKNEITSMGAIALLNCMTARTNLETLDLSENRIDASIVQTIEQVLPKIMHVNRRFSKFSLSENQIDSTKLAHVNKMFEDIMKYNDDFKEAIKTDLGKYLNINGLRGVAVCFFRQDLLNIRDLKSKDKAEIEKLLDSEYVDLDDIQTKSTLQLADYIHVLMLALTTTEENIEIDDDDDDDDLMDLFG